MNIKNVICAASGAVGAALVNLFGGADVAIGTLILFIVIDYITGILVALAKNSLKTASGGLNSSVGFKGLCKKVYGLAYGSSGG